MDPEAQQRLREAVADDYTYRRDRPKIASILRELADENSQNIVVAPAAHRAKAYAGTTMRCGAAERYSSLSAACVAFRST